MPKISGEMPKKPGKLPECVLGYKTGESLWSMALRMTLIGAKPWRMRSSWNFCSDEGRALLLADVFTELHDLEFAEGVVEIERVCGSALGFDLGDGARLVAVGDEEVLGLVNGHGAADSGVHADADDEAGVAQESILQLAEADEFGFALGFFAAGGRVSMPGCAVAFVEHHLLAVVGPAFDVGVGAEELADF